jgi:Flp pilus assembly CpaE family ATPase
MSGQDGSTNNTLESSLGITPATNLPSEQANNNSRMTQELEELKAKVKTLKGMAQIEGRTRTLENQNRKRARTDKHLTS